MEKALGMGRGSEGEKGGRGGEGDGGWGMLAQGGLPYPSHIPPQMGLAIATSCYTNLCDSTPNAFVLALSPAIPARHLQHHMETKGMEIMKCTCIRNLETCCFCNSLLRVEGWATLNYGYNTLDTTTRHLVEETTSTLAKGNWKRICLATSRLDTFPDKHLCHRYYQLKMTEWNSSTLLFCRLVNPRSWAKRRAVY